MLHEGLHDNGGTPRRVFNLESPLWILYCGTKEVPLDCGRLPQLEGLMVTLGYGLDDQTRWL